MRNAEEPPDLSRTLNTAQSMDNLTLFAGFAGITALWSQMRSILDRLRGLFIQRTTLNGHVAYTVTDFLYAKTRVWRWGDAFIRSESTWVRPRQRVMEVAYETASVAPVVSVWRRGHLLYGTPGTGKTALVRAIAQEADFPVYAFDLSTLGNEEFRHAWNDMQESAPCIALIEDIDGVFHGRENVLAQQEGMRSSLTFDCLLNAIGGIETADGVFLVITTNKPDLLDEALGKPTGTGTSTRPGRLDRTFLVPPLDDQGRASILRRICGTCSDDDVRATAGMSAAQTTEHAITKALNAMWTPETPAA